MGWIAEDSYHFLVVFSIIIIIIYFIHAIINFHPIWSLILWWINLSLTLVVLWNTMWTGALFFNISSDVYVFFFVIAIAGLLYWLTDVTIDMVITITIGLIFVAFTFAGRDYGIAYMNTVIHYDLPIWVYILIVIGGIGIIIFIKKKFIEGNDTLEFFEVLIIQSILCYQAVYILYKEDITCFFCNTSIELFEFDTMFFIGISILGVLYYIITRISPFRKNKKKKQIEQEQKQKEKEINITPTTTTTIPRPSSPPPSSSSSSSGTILSFMNSLKQKQSMYLSKPRSTTTLEEHHTLLN